MMRDCKRLLGKKESQYSNNLIENKMYEINDISYSKIPLNENEKKVVIKLASVKESPKSIRNHVDSEDLSFEESFNNKSNKSNID